MAASRHSAEQDFDFSTRVFFLIHREGHQYPYAYFLQIYQSYWGKNISFSVVPAKVAELIFIDQVFGPAWSQS